MRAESQPDARRDAIDVARVLALAMVVAGHLLLAVVDRDGDGIRGTNLLSLRPGWAWIAALAPMPVFFAAAGWANARTSPTDAARRLASLVAVASVVVGVWSAGVVVATVVSGDPGVVGDGARVATQPLWFLAAYLPLAIAGRWIARAAAGAGPALVIAAVATLTISDVARFAFDAPEWIGWPGFFLAWGVPWVLGAWWRDRWADRPDGRRERVAGAALLAVGAAVAVGLVRWAGYNAALIDAVDGSRSNTTPPTLYTAVAAIAQTGVLMLLAGALDRAGRRARRLWDRAGAAAVGVYVWHLTALALCVGLIGAGLPAPERLTPRWWWTRPLWWSLVLLVTLGLVVATDAVRRRVPRRAVRAPRHVATVRVAGVAAGAAGAAFVGLEGPRTAPAALASTALFVGSWLALRAAAAHPTDADEAWDAGAQSTGRGRPNR